MENNRLRCGIKSEPSYHVRPSGMKTCKIAHRNICNGLGCGLPKSKPFYIPFAILSPGLLDLDGGGQLFPIAHHPCPPCNHHPADLPLLNTVESGLHPNLHSDRCSREGGMGICDNVPPPPLNVQSLGFTVLAFFLFMLASATPEVVHGALGVGHAMPMSSLVM